MIKGIYTAAAGMLSQAQKLDIIGNNLANINTTGYKKDNAFVELMKDAGNVVAQPTTDGAPVFVKAYTDLQNGSLNQTNNRLDVAIQGRGFFTIDTPQGIRYTRNGNFSLSVDGTVVTNEGYPVQGVGGRIQLPDLHRLSSVDLSIAENGEMMIDKRIIAQLRIADFDDLTGLTKEGHSMFVAEVPERSAVMNGTDTILRQGYLEESNVNGLEEMVMMIEIQRAFEAEQKSIQMLDGTIERSLEVGRV
jgi:flagellar basal-body rod protein FlgF